MSSASKKQGTRVFKKGSPNGKITVYLGKRDFVDHVTHVDPIDGVVLVDPEYLKDRKVFGHVLAAFRYGREDLDVLGLTFRFGLLTISSNFCKPIFQQEGPVPGLVPDIPHTRGLRGPQEATDPAAGEADQEAGRQRVPILLWVAAPLPSQRDAPARPGGHRWGPSLTEPSLIHIKEKCRVHNM